MEDSSGVRTAIWATTSDAQLPRSPLAEDATVDVCIIGAGITGLSVAYHLACAGQSVLVLEDGEIGSGETGRTTAHLVNVLDDRYTEIERVHGPTGARLAAASHTAAIDCLEAIITEERIGCDFERVDGYLFVPPGGDRNQLDRELAAVQRAGLDGVTTVARAPLPSYNTGPCLQFPRQAQFHPMKYLAGLAAAIEARGGRICTHSHADDMRGGETATVEANGRTITASALIVATNTPVNDRVTMHTKQAAYRTFVVGLSVPRGSVARALFWDTADPYHYVRIVPATDREDVLIVGGEDHKTGQDDDGEARFARLTAWTRERFPMAGDVRYAWSGQVMEPVDGMAFIGRNPGDAPNVFIATGDSGNGMTHGTIAGMLLTDLILGRNNAWQALYDPARISVRAASEFVKENVNVAVQYADLVTGGDIDHLDQLARETGAVLRQGSRKIAAYRDAEGRVHEFSAFCPHLGCVVEWNGVEKTWDCPCHGSRFTPTGDVVNGPALVGLRPAGS